MKSMHAYQLYKPQMEKVMAQDDQDQLEYEAVQYDRGDNRKVQPAYMQGDLGEDMKRDAELKRHQRIVLERQRERGLRR